MDNWDKETSIYNAFSKFSSTEEYLLFFLASGKVEWSSSHCKRQADSPKVIYILPSPNPDYGKIP